MLQGKTCGMFTEQENGGLRVYHPPVKGMGYSIGADVAMGLATGDGSAAFVLGRDMKHYASFYGKIAPDLFGEFLCRLGNWFNNALLVPEVNNMGLLTLDRIKDKNYPNIYTREVNEVIGEELKNRIGWESNVKTKRKMLDEFVAHYRDKKIIINDIELLKEMSSLKVEDNGHIILSGKDRIVSACLAIQGLSQVVIDGEFKASNPLTGFKGKEGEITNLSIEDKLKYYKMKRGAVSSFS